MLSQLGEETLPAEFVSTIQPFRRDVVKCSQGFQKVPLQQLPDDTIGRPMMHLSALQQATGEARYMVRYENFLAFLMEYASFIRCLLTGC